MSLWKGEAWDETSQQSKSGQAEKKLLHLNLPSSHLDWGRQHHSYCRHTVFGLCPLSAERGDCVALPSLLTYFPGEVGSSGSGKHSPGDSIYSSLLPPQSFPDGN